MESEGVIDSESDHNTLGVAGYHSWVIYDIGCNYKNMVF